MQIFRVLTAPWAAQHAVLGNPNFSSHDGLLFAIDGDVAGWVLDRGGGLGQRHDAASLQQPAQAHAVEAAQAAVAGVWLFRGLMEAEQVARRPAERLSLLAPGRQEAAAVLNGMLPAHSWNMVRTARLERGEGAIEATEAILQSRRERNKRIKRTKPPYPSPSPLFTLNTLFARVLASRNSRRACREISR